MIISSVAAARAIWLFDVSDLNPHGHYIYDRLFAWLVARYNFVKSPANARDQDDSKAWVFSDGRFVTPANVPVDMTLKVFNDGIVGETHSSTNDSDAFLADVLNAATAELGLSFTGSMVHRRLYASELNLMSEKSLDALNPRMRAFSEALSTAFGTRCELTAIGCGGDPASQPLFRFERKVNYPFSQNKYWSTASLTTDVHLSLLNQLEALLSP